jgi:crotonobetainyl-CoA:carnitine CoA-transferase CaiB-like acyl-CoA transferase
LALNPLYALNADRVRHRAELIPLLESLMKTRTKADWLPALEAAKVPCGAINSLGEVFADPQVLERNMVSHWPHPVEPGLRLVASPIKMSRTPVRQDLPPPMLGQHTSEVLSEILGLPMDQQTLLRTKGVIE